LDYKTLQKSLNIKLEQHNGKTGWLTVLLDTLQATTETMSVQIDDQTITSIEGGWSVALTVTGSCSLFSLYDI